MNLSFEIFTFRRRGGIIITFIIFCAISLACMYMYKCLTWAHFLCLSPLLSSSSSSFSLTLSFALSLSVSLVLDVYPHVCLPFCVSLRCFSLTLTLSLLLFSPTPTLFAYLWPSSIVQFTLLLYKRRETSLHFMYSLYRKSKWHSGNVKNAFHVP